MEALLDQVFVVLPQGQLAKLMCWIPYCDGVIVDLWLQVKIEI